MNLTLTPKKVLITFEMEELYTNSLVYGLAEDHNVYQAMKGSNIHRDAESAKQAGFDRPIAVGMLSYGLLCEWLAEIFGEEWHTGGELEVAFLKPVYFDSIVEVGGQQVPQTDEWDAQLDVWIKDEEGNYLVSGKAFFKRG